MKIALGSDHAGFSLKEQLRAMLVRKGHDVTDFGAAGPESTDYPDYAAAVGRAVAGGSCERGVLVCSTGVGMSMAANKVPGIRAALAFNADEVEYTRRHNDANVLTMGAKYLDVEAAGALIDVFLTTAFEGGRHQRRVDKIMSIEKEGKQG